MIGSRLRAAPFLCPPLPLSFPGAPLQPPPSTAPSSQRAPSPRSTIRTCPSNPVPPPAHPPGGAPTPRHLPHRPLPAPPLHRPVLPAGPQPRGAFRTRPSTPASPASLPLGGAPTLWRFPHWPLPAPPLHRPVLLAGPHPRSASRTSRSQPPPRWHPFLLAGLQPRGASRTDLSRPRLSDTPSPGGAPPESTTCPSGPVSPRPFSSGGDHPPLNFILHRVPLLPPSLLSKTDLGAAFPCLLAAPGRFWALFGLFRVLFGLFRVFFEKSWAKNFLFSLAFGIIKPLTGTARR